MDTATIHENGVEMQIDDAYADRLDKQGILYKCDSCSLWHITPGMDWCDVELAIIQMEMDERS